MDVAQFKACVTCTATIDRDQVLSPLSSNGFTYNNFKKIYVQFIDLFQYKSQFNNVFNVNPGNQGSPVTFCGLKDSTQRTIIKKCFLFMVVSVCNIKQWTTGSRNSLKTFKSCI
jgi:hypothetical protein